MYILQYKKLCINLYYKNSNSNKENLIFTESSYVAIKCVEYDNLSSQWLRNSATQYYTGCLQAFVGVCNSATQYYMGCLQAYVGI